LVVVCHLAIKLSGYVPDTVTPQTADIQ